MSSRSGSSFLRLLSPRRTSTALPSSPSINADDPSPKLTFHVPRYGAVFMPHFAPPNPLEPDPVTEDYVLTGELEIQIPKGGRRKKVKRITVELRSELRLDLDPLFKGKGKGKEKENGKIGRGEEIDFLFVKKLEIGDEEEGIWLEEGSQRFEFSFILKGDTPCHDFAGRLGRLRYMLYGYVEGLSIPKLDRTFSNSTFTAGSPTSPSLLYSFNPFANPSGPAGQTSQAHALGVDPEIDEYALDRPPTPQLPHDHLELESQFDRSVSKLSISDPITTIPSYAESEAERLNQESDWVIGRITVKKVIAIVHNPDPDNGVSRFNDNYERMVDGLGLVDIRSRTDEWTIANYVNTRISLPTLSPLVTIFAFLVKIHQERTLTSMRDGYSKTTKETFTVLQAGKIPPVQHVHAYKEVPALWRGAQAGGKDSGEWSWSGIGRLPFDSVLRASTLAGIQTPIRNSHTWTYEIYFSVWGQMSDGSPTPARNSPGMVRLMKRSLPIILPSCALISQVLGLPNYADVDDEYALNAKCPICGIPAHQQICQTCPPSTITHLVHSLPVGKEFIPGVTSCPRCYGRSFVPSGRSFRHMCACDRPLDQAPVMKEIEEDEEEEENDDERWESKRVAEGRQR